MSFIIKAVSVLYLFLIWAQMAAPYQPMAAPYQPMADIFLAIALEGHKDLIETCLFLVDNTITNNKMVNL